MGVCLFFFKGSFEVGIIGTPRYGDDLPETLPLLVVSCLDYGLTGELLLDWERFLILIALIVVVGEWNLDLLWSKGTPQTSRRAIAPPFLNCMRLWYLLNESLREDSSSSLLLSIIVIFFLNWVTFNSCSECLHLKRTLNLLYVGDSHPS